MKCFIADRGKLRIQGKSLIVALLFVSALLLGATTASAGSIEVDKIQIIPLATFSGGTPATTGFDIGWVDPGTGTYYLAERTGSAPGVVDIFNGIEDEFEASLPYFVGTVSVTKGPADGRGSRKSGPNGIVVVPAKSSKKELWAGDGDSTVKVIDLSTTALVAIIPTGGIHRADELAYDPIHRIIMVANDLEPVDANGNAITTTGPSTASFVTFIDQKTRTVKGHIYYDGLCTSPPCPTTIVKGISISHGPNANPPGVGPGLEQPVFDSPNFYFSVPATADMLGGEIDVIDPVKMRIVARYDAQGCNPSGLALGPHHHLVMGCGGPPTPIMNDRDGSIVAYVPGIGGADEVWFNPGDMRYYLAAGAPGLPPVPPGTPVLGVIDAVKNILVATVPTGPGAHSVAVNPLNNHVYVPNATDRGISVFEAADDNSEFDLNQICKELGQGQEQGFKEKKRGQGEGQSYNEWGRR